MLPRAAKRTLPRVEPIRNGSLSRGKAISVCCALSVETLLWRRNSVDQRPHVAAALRCWTRTRLSTHKQTHGLPPTCNRYTQLKNCLPKRKARSNFPAAATPDVSGRWTRSAGWNMGVVDTRKCCAVILGKETTGRNKILQQLKNTSMFMRITSGCSSLLLVFRSAHSPNLWGSGDRKGKGMRRATTHVRLLSQHPTVMTRRLRRCVMMVPLKCNSCHRLSSHTQTVAFDKKLHC
jgi:hypothetical protein